MSKENFFGTMKNKGAVRIADDAADRFLRIGKAQGFIAKRYETMQPVLTMTKRGEVKIESSAKAHYAEIVGRYTTEKLKGCDLTRVEALAAMIAEDLQAHPHAPKMLEAA